MHSSFKFDDETMYEDKIAALARRYYGAWLKGEAESDGGAAGVFALHLQAVDKRGEGLVVTVRTAPARSQEARLPTEPYGGLFGSFATTEQSVCEVKDRLLIAFESMPSMNINETCP